MSPAADPGFMMHPTSNLFLTIYTTFHAVPPIYISSSFISSWLHVVAYSSSSLANVPCCSSTRYTTHFRWQSVILPLMNGIQRPEEVSVFQTFPDLPDLLRRILAELRVYFRRLSSTKYCNSRIVPTGRLNKSWPMLFCIVLSLLLAIRVKERRSELLSV